MLMVGSFFVANAFGLFTACLLGSSVCFVRGSEGDFFITGFIIVAVKSLCIVGMKLVRYV